MSPGRPATATITGINVHPGYAKDQLVSAIKAASMFVSLLPAEMTPETTEKREGYLHPVSISGGVEEVVIKLILREFDEEPLLAQRDILEGIGQISSGVSDDIDQTYDLVMQGIDDFAEGQRLSLAEQVSEASADPLEPVEDLLAI